MGIENLLVVDDNPADIRFIEESIDGSELHPTIHPATTAETALEFVHQRGEYRGTPDPDVVLLDWNLSRTTGKEVLTAIKSACPATSVVVMTGSQAQAKELETSVSGADMYIQKPPEPEGYIDALRSVY